MIHTGRVTLPWLVTEMSLKELSGSWWLPVAVGAHDTCSRGR